MAEVMALGWGVWAVCALAVFGGTILQRLAGQGFGMIAAPMLAMVAPGYLPATLLLLGLVVGFGATSVDTSALSRDELVPGFVGRALGAVIAAWIAVRVMDSDALVPLVAGMVYLAIALSLLGVRVAIRPLSLAIAGCAGGIMGTLTAVGAPPMALLYQHEEARRSAAMQNAFYAFGMIVSVSVLSVAGLIGWRHLILAVSLAPVAVAALWGAHPLARKVARARMRPVALGLAFVAATVLIARQLFAA